jgi:hypothetical protein
LLQVEELVQRTRESAAADAREAAQDDYRKK